MTGLAFVTGISTAAWAVENALPEQDAAPQWVVPGSLDERPTGAFLFRCRFDLEELPEEARLNVTADDCFRLLLNGVPIGEGPPRSNPQRWHDCQLDCSGQLKLGENVLCALVWNYGKDRPMSRPSVRTAFRCSASFSPNVRTGSGGWRFSPCEAITMHPFTEWWKWAGGWYAEGPGERIDMRRFRHAWSDLAFDDSDWSVPIPLPSSSVEWQTHLSELPQPTSERFPVQQVIVEESQRESKRVPLTGPLTIGANQEESWLLDMGRLIVGRPVLKFSGGADAEITLTFVESPFGESGKGNRDIVTGKRFQGVKDRLVLSGSKVVYEPLSRRTARYIHVQVKTQSEPVVLEEAAFRLVVYPFTQIGSFECSDPTLGEIWRLGAWTTRCCALDIYVDCPYYEQLNYGSDTRVQALMSLYLYGDDRLIKESLLHLKQSQLPKLEGLTLACYPSCKEVTIIPAHSLDVANMVWEHYLHCNDQQFAGEFREFMVKLFDWFDVRIGENGLLGPTEHWNFTDWNFGERGCPPGQDGDDRAGSSSILTLQYLYALQKASRLAEALGWDGERAEWQSRAKSLRAAVLKHCYDAKRGVVANDPTMQTYSQHANILAVLTDLLTPKQQRVALAVSLVDPESMNCTTFYRFHLFEAMRKAGMAQGLLDQLQPWHKMLAQGMTTTSETGDKHWGSGRPDDRSDCHAWSAAPTYAFLATTTGIRPLTPGFKEVLIEPAMGDLRWLKATAAIPQGAVQVDISQKKRGKLTGIITLPAGVTGQFRASGETLSLKSGKNVLVIPSKTSVSIKAE